MRINPVINAFKACKETGAITPDVLEQQFNVHKNGFNLFRNSVTQGVSVNMYLVKEMRNLFEGMANSIIASLLNTPCQIKFTPLGNKKANPLQGLKMGCVGHLAQKIIVIKLVSGALVYGIFAM